MKMNFEEMLKKCEFAEGTKEYVLSTKEDVIGHYPLYCHVRDYICLTTSELPYIKKDLHIPYARHIDWMKRLLMRGCLL